MTIIKSAHDGYPLIFDLDDAINTLEALIDGSEECVARDSRISEIIRYLRHKEAQENYHRRHF